MRYNGIYSAGETSQVINTDEVLVELQVPADVQIEIIRMWVGAAEVRVGGWANAPDDVEAVDIYGNDGPATGGAGLTEQKLRGTDDAASAVTALGGQPTIAATPTTLIADAFHVQNGFLYLPTPEERIRIVGGAAIDNIGFKIADASAVAILTLSYGIIWGELG